MLKYRHVVFILLIITGFTVSAQQEPQITHFMFNQMSFNPGYAGVREAICINVLARQQWVGFTDVDKDGKSVNVSPQTNIFTIDAPIDKLFKRNFNSGIGLMIMTDKLGFEENLQLRLNYAYKFNIGPGRMSAGISTGFLNKIIDFSQFRPYDAIESGGPTNDPLLKSSGKVGDMLMDIAFGMYYNVPDKFYVGLSASQLLESKFTEVLPDTSPYKLRRHYYLTGGYFMELLGTNWSLNPNLLVKSDLGSFQVDANVIGVYNSQVWGGISYRVFDAVALMVGAFPFTAKGLDALRLGYSYDITTSKLGRSGRSSGSHEIYANYCFKIIIVRIPTGYSNVRYLPTL